MSSSQQQENIVVEVLVRKTLQLVHVNNQMVIIPLGEFMQAFKRRKRSRWLALAIVQEVSNWGSRKVLNSDWRGYLKILKWFQCTAFHLYSQVLQTVDSPGRIQEIETLFSQELQKLLSSTRTHRIRESEASKIMKKFHRSFATGLLPRQDETPTNNGSSSYEIQVKIDNSEGYFTPLKEIFTLALLDAVEAQRVKKKIFSLDFEDKNRDVPDLEQRVEQSELFFSSHEFKNNITNTKTLDGVENIYVDREVTMVDISRGVRDLKTKGNIQPNSRNKVSISQINFLFSDRSSLQCEFESHPSLLNSVGDRMARDPENPNRFFMFLSDPNATQGVKKPRTFTKTVALSTIVIKSRRSKDGQQQQRVAFIEKEYSFSFSHRSLPLGILGEDTVLMIEGSQLQVRNVKGDILSKKRLHSFKVFDLIENNNGMKCFKFIQRTGPSRNWSVGILFQVDCPSQIVVAVHQSTYQIAVLDNFKCQKAPQFGYHSKWLQSSGMGEVGNSIVFEVSTQESKNREIYTFGMKGVRLQKVLTIQDELLKRQHPNPEEMERLNANFNRDIIPVSISLRK